MSDKHTDTNLKLPQWLHRVYNAVTNVNVPRPLRLAYLVRQLGYNKQHVRQECDQPNKPYKSGKPAEPSKCGIFTCGSNDQYCYCLTNVKCHECFDTGYDASGLQCGCTINELGWFKCPSNNKLCHVDTCPNGKCKDEHERGYN